MRYKKFLFLPILVSLFILPIASIASFQTKQTSLIENANKHQINQSESINNSYDYEKLKLSFLKDLNNSTNSNFVSNTLSSTVQIPITNFSTFHKWSIGASGGSENTNNHISTDIKLFAKIDYSNYYSSTSPNIKFYINAPNVSSNSVFNWKNKSIQLNSLDVKNNQSNDFGFFKTINSSNVKMNFKNTEISEIYRRQTRSSGGSQGRTRTDEWWTKAFINSSFETIVNPNFSNQIDLSKLFKLHLNNGNSYSDNGQVFSKAPELKLELNDEFLLIIQELHNLYEAYNMLIQYKSKNDIYGYPIFAGNKNEWFNIIVHNIFNRTKTAEEIKNDIANTEKNIKPTKSENTLALFKKMNEFNLQIPNVNLNNSKTFYEIQNIINYEYPYQIILNFFKNYKINVKYETPLSKNAGRLEYQTIWDGNNFSSIKMQSRSDSNKSYIDILDISFEKIGNTNMQVQKFSPIDIIYDKSFTNIIEDSNSIKYEALYRQDANNYNDFTQNSSTINSRAIEIPFDKYASTIVYPDNTFVDWAFVGTTINKYLYDKNDTNKDLFSAVVPITSQAILNSTSNWKDAYKEFGLLDSQNKINFTRNNYDGIFYVVGEINDWKFIDDNLNDEMQGNFTKTFREKIRNNKDIIELESVNPNATNGFFLLRVKTNKTIPNPNKSNNINPEIDNNFGDSWNNSSTIPSILNKIENDRANPLLRLNTKEINNYIKDEINNPNNWIDDTKINNYFASSNEKIWKKLNLNKELNLSLPSYDHPYLIDKDLINKYLKNSPSLFTRYSDPIQNSLGYLWSRSINFSNENTNMGKIVSRKFVTNEDVNVSDIGIITLPVYDYFLNDEYQYQDNFIQEDSHIKEGTLKIINKSNIRSTFFNYKITIGQLIDMFSIYQNSNDFGQDYNNSKVTMQTVLDKYYIEINKTNIGNIIAIIIGLLVAIALLSIITYIIIKRKKQKKVDYLLK